MPLVKTVPGCKALYAGNILLWKSGRQVKAKMKRGISAGARLFDITVREARALSEINASRIVVESVGSHTINAAVEGMRFKSSSPQDLEIRLTAPLGVAVSAGASVILRVNE